MKGNLVAEKSEFVQQSVEVTLFVKKSLNGEDLNNQNGKHRAKVRRRPKVHLIDEGEVG